MIKYFVISQFIGSIATFIVGMVLLFVIQKKTVQKVEKNESVGFWVRAICFGTDLAIIDIITAIFVYHSNLQIAGYLTIVIITAYFLFFWLVFSATPSQMFAHIRIVARKGGNVKVWQYVVRLLMFFFLVIGWITILFDKKRKRALHDFVSDTYVIYSNEYRKNK